ncbi:MAG: sugar phosphate isomerase/epimerase [Puniceicoccales bacterium]|jgi:sugar phosphate isomerase/epimerase|nr:sugar phosphate isomerase/epimerase [Puniceicoccales bacterium]
MATSLKLSQLAVCSWSGWPDSVQTLLSRLEAIGLKRIQLALDPLIDKPEAWGGTLGRLRDAGISVVSGMFGTPMEDYSTPATIRATGGVAPDAACKGILSRVPRYLELLDALEIDKVSFHAGFIPHSSSDPRYDSMRARLATVAEAFAKGGKLLLLETGQESAPTLDALLRSLALPNLRVNFDPGNMLLYSMGDPVAALELLLPHIAQIHIKDAIPSGDPEVWGREVPAGEGEVDWRRFFAILEAAGYAGDLVIERECGDDPVGEIRRAIGYLKTHLAN